MMNKEEFNKKYKDVDLKFTGYYKYSFSFEGTAPDGVTIYTSYGGNADDIYRYDVSPDNFVKFESTNSWSYVSAKKDDKEIFRFSDY